MRGLLVLAARRQASRFYWLVRREIAGFLLRDLLINPAGVRASSGALAPHPRPFSPKRKMSRLATIDNQFIFLFGEKGALGTVGSV